LGMEKENKNACTESPQEKCENCRFWFDDKNCTQRGKVGYCRIYPPGFTVDARWPVTEGHEWCGEFERRIEGYEQ